VSNPLFINNHWSVLYFLNGQKQYGYMPVWTGPHQERATFFEDTNERPQVRFLILDPSNQLLDFAYRATIYAEDQISVLDEVKQFGEIIVQKRHIPPDPSELKDTQKLTPGEIIEVERVLSIDGGYSCQ